MHFLRWKMSQIPYTVDSPRSPLEFWSTLKTIYFEKLQEIPFPHAGNKFSDEAGNFQFSANYAPLISRTRENSSKREAMNFPVNRHSLGNVPSRSTRRNNSRLENNFPAKGEWNQSDQTTTRRNPPVKRRETRYEREQLSIGRIGFQSVLDVLRGDQGRENGFCKAVRKLHAAHSNKSESRQLRRPWNIFTHASPYKRNQSRDFPIGFQRE